MRVCHKRFQLLSRSRPGLASRHYSSARVSVRQPASTAIVRGSGEAVEVMVAASSVIDLTLAFVFAKLRRKLSMLADSAQQCRPTAILGSNIPRLSGSINTEERFRIRRGGERLRFILNNPASGRRIEAAQGVPYVSMPGCNPPSLPDRF